MNTGRIEEMGKLVWDFEEIICLEAKESACRGYLTSKEIGKCNLHGSESTLFLQAVVFGCLELESWKKVPLHSLFTSPNLTMGDFRAPNCPFVRFLSLSFPFGSMDFRDGAHELSRCVVTIGNIWIRLLWHFLQILVSAWYSISAVGNLFESYFISCGVLEKYKSLHAEKIRYLAIVIESEEAYQISKVVRLLEWLDSIGVKNVCLYDMNGLLKKSRETIFQNLKNAKSIEVLYNFNLHMTGVFNSVQDVSQSVAHHAPDHMTLEFLSYLDGKEAVAKAANLVFGENLKRHSLGGELDAQISLELHLNEALQIVGSKGPEPDLLLVYGPVRSHLGFPAWRLRYTEIVHMGSLNFMRYGSLLKVIYNFTKVHQNYVWCFPRPDNVGTSSEFAFSRSVVIWLLPTMASKSRSSLAETPNKEPSATPNKARPSTLNRTPPATPRVSKLSKAVSKRESESFSPLQNSNFPTEKPHRALNSKPTSERKSLRFTSNPLDKQFPRVAKDSELQAQLNLSQEDLKNTKEQLIQTEKEKAETIDELKAAQRVAEEANEKLREAMVAQKQAEESFEIWKFRAVELEQAGIQAAQKKEEEWQKELESVRNQHALDVAALFSTTQELQQVKQILAMTSDAKNQAQSHAELHMVKAEILSAELTQLKLLKKSALISLESVMKQLERNNDSLLDAESEISNLKEKVGLLEMTIRRQRGDLVDSERCLLVAKEESVEMSKKVESLKIELETEKAQTLNKEKLAASSLQTLLEEKNKLIYVLGICRDEEEKTKKVMESLAAALHEISAEARYANEKLLANQAELENYETQIEDLKLILQNTNEKYESMLHDTRKDSDAFICSVENAKDIQNYEATIELNHITSAE
ncbi:unnamed protein product [Sphenostylis stenocarpa]|uniref:ditrans,polycis-polyprenyl diphosphate synthase [(2E,6E)-farnesyldiphosphate specific] n=1 Tax=Sphenostylis stenocarpa TaxID=92480 RepID=A0AA86V858_9FABA|nr:unnamed protein product [Sphenostylis stenocarpa]